jgi:UDP-3-O-[3-hydroxymyristoyl] glucosamine N-acyltransferase
MSAGSLLIDENVEIQNNCCVDKGIFGITYLGKNVKLDNLVHVGHDVIISKNVFLTAGVILAGRVKIKDNSYLGPNCTIKNGLVLGKNSKISMGSVVTKNVNDNETVTGNFAIPHEQFIKNLKKI